MRLTKIKLSGFKSFVDPTTFQAPTNLTGIVGPNGCGKSNIMDAIRWVMGEGSARVLRGELMSDVIFSGSSTRKPVGTATVELEFDNSDGQIGGELAGFNEISVKRQVARDGISQYTLNGTRCRRKDIKDLFLGTGLGSKSYSIIEQGMISQVVDAHPEQIREHLEEAAGISKYKERRRETERRIEHTRENLDRLADLREEVGNQLNRLKRQANAAEQYRKLKKQQRELESRLLALQWREQARLGDQGKTGLQIQETALQEQLAEQRAAESRMEALHQQQADAGEQFNLVQAELYSVSGDIARLEQSMLHTREMQQQQLKEYEEISVSLNDLQQHMMLDRTQVEHLTSKLAETEPALALAEREESDSDQQLVKAESAVQTWQEKFEAYHRANAELSRETDGLKSRIEVLDQRMATTRARLEELGTESSSSAAGPQQELLATLSEKLEKAANGEQQAQKALDAARKGLLENRKLHGQARELERETQARLNSAQARLEALRAIRDVSSDTKEGQAWLTQQELDNAPRLASEIRTEKGWESAVETVLGPWLQSLMVTDPAAPAQALSTLKNADLAVFRNSRGKIRTRSGTLAEKVKGPDAVIALLNHVRVADSLEAAAEYLDIAGGEQTAITRDGIWIGPGWIRVSRLDTGKAGILARESEMATLENTLVTLHKALKNQQAQIEESRDAIRAAELATDSGQDDLNRAHRLRSDLESQLAATKTRIEELRAREGKIEQESARLQTQQAEDSKEIKAARQKLSVKLDQMAADENVRLDLDQQRQKLLESRDSSRKAAIAARDTRHELALKSGSRRASLDSLQQSLARMDNQVSQLQQRYLALSETIALAKDPGQEFKADMDQLLQRRVEVETRLSGARKHLQSLEEEYRELDVLRQQSALKNDEIRSSLERARLQQQAVELTAHSLKQRVEALGENVETLAEALPETAESESWQQDIERLETRITRLEPVNLAAISEYEAEFKRKEYMDAQNEDLTKALETLEGAIARIDRKTRTRFKDTFEQVNKGMQELFPRLFGGGHAYLELTGDDLLTTGVSIMVRPPGKRVSSIHLLSGGEKALTAVAFVFSIFQLNPAPFCLLDEVDAPLDDANVGRFSALVKEMSETVQFIVVTHNKITMEMVHQLSGVTMREPGVSRLVQVDIEEAARLAAS